MLLFHFQDSLKGSALSATVFAHTVSAFLLHIMLSGHTANTQLWCWYFLFNLEVLFCNKEVKTYLIETDYSSRKSPLISEINPE